MKKGSKSVRDPQKLASELEQLRELNSEELRERWQTLFGAEPPPKLRSSLLVQGIAYRLQEKALGGLKPSAQRVLDRVCDQPRDSGPTRVTKTKVNAGTVLIREWRGVRHRVTVLDHGVVYRSRRYQSLSEVARAITSTHWSGPVFFDLWQRAQKAAARG